MLYNPLQNLHKIKLKGMGMSNQNQANVSQVSNEDTWYSCCHGRNFYYAHSHSTPTNQVMHTIHNHQDNSRNLSQCNHIPFHLYNTIHCHSKSWTKPSESKHFTFCYSRILQKLCHPSKPFIINQREHETIFYYIKTHPFKCNPIP